MLINIHLLLLYAHTALYIDMPQYPTTSKTEDKAVRTKANHSGESGSWRLPPVLYCTGWPITIH
jgi:hypothetical protein